LIELGRDKLFVSETDVFSEKNIKSSVLKFKVVFANLKKRVYCNNYRPKDVKCLMAKIRKELNSIETTEICKAIKEVPLTGCNFFLQVICV
jgi:hypothetical protein